VIVLVALVGCAGAVAARCVLRTVQRGRSFNRLGSYGGYRRQRDPIDPVT
jgi:hypothetical protein